MNLVSSQTRVPVPQVEYVDLSHDLIDADWFFMEFIDADNFGLVADSGRLDPATVSAGNRELGAMNREINSITGTHFGPLLGAGSDTWRQAFMQIVEDTLRDGERVGIDLGWDHDEIRQVLQENARTLDEVVVPRLIEVDLWTKNSMIQDGKIVAILDHERAMYGDPLMEAGLAGMDIPAFGDPTEFMVGFGIEELTESERVRRRLYSLYLSIVMVVETKYRDIQTP